MKTVAVGIWNLEEIHHLNNYNALGPFEMAARNNVNIYIYHLDKCIALFYQLQTQ